MWKRKRNNLGYQAAGQQNKKKQLSPLHSDDKTVSEKFTFCLHILCLCNLPKKIKMALDKVPAKNEISELSDSCLERCTDGALLHRWSPAETEAGWRKLSEAFLNCETPAAHWQLSQIESLLNADLHITIHSNSVEGIVHQKRAKRHTCWILTHWQAGSLKWRDCWPISKTIHALNWKLISF